MSTIATATQVAHIVLDLDQTDRLIIALQKARRAAALDVINYGGEGVDARVLLTAHSNDDGNPRLDVESLESWVGTYAILDLDLDI